MTNWPKPVLLREFAPGHVHVWRMRLGRGPAGITEARLVLSTDELARADRFQFAADGSSFVERRSALRRLLARYLGCAPAEIGFRHPGEGRPELAPGTGAGLHFSSSFSGAWALIAVSTNERVGVDVERVRPIADMDSVAETVFSPRELANYQSAPAGDKMRAFFNGWTRKEAFVKALGKGFAFPMRDFDVSLDPSEPARVLRVAGDGTEPRHWSLTAVEPAAGYVGAVAVAEPEIHLSQFELQAI